MNLIDLVLTVCSLAAPEHCAERHIALDFEQSPAACSMQVQPFLAQWLGGHPGLRIARWKCMWPQMEAREG